MMDYFKIIKIIFCEEFSKNIDEYAIKLSEYKQNIYYNPNWLKCIHSKKFRGTTATD